LTFLFTITVHRHAPTFTHTHTHAHIHNLTTTQVRDGEEFTAVAAGEDLGVEVTFTNPLGIKLRLTGVRLVYEFQREKFGEGGDGAAGGAAGAAPGASSGGQVADADGGGAAVQATAAQFTLHPSEVLAEKLTLRPLAAGWLRVTGVEWVVEGGVEGRTLFEIKGRHRKRPKGDR
jgi:hypothetical protein